MKYIDIHCHLDSSDYDTDRAEVLARMKRGEIGAITVGADLESSKRAVEIAETNENIWSCIGIHPGESNREAQDTRYDERKFGDLVKNSKVVGVGECGLDFFKLDPAFAETTANKQKKLFESQIQFALKHNKPLMIHCRDSYEDVLDILNSYKKEAGEKLRGNVHFFAGNIPVAKRFLDLGFSMSFTGVITFTEDYDEVIKYLPMDSIMSETDAPWVAPVPYRGKRNEPAYVPEVVKKMAEIKGKDQNVLNRSILVNFRRIFRV